MTIDFGINLADLLSYVGPVMTQLWPVIALLGGISLAFWIAGYVRRAVRPRAR